MGVALRLFDTALAGTTLVHAANNNLGVSLHSLAWPPHADCGSRIEAHPERIVDWSGADKTYAGERKVHARRLTQTIRPATEEAWTVMASGGATWPISVYLMVLAAITFLAARVAPETARNALN
jgi:hypothetical protein